MKPSAEMERLEKLARIYSARAIGTAKKHALGDNAPTAVTDRQSAADLRWAIGRIETLQLALELADATLAIQEGKAHV